MRTFFSHIGTSGSRIKKKKNSFQKIWMSWLPMQWLLKKKSFKTNNLPDRHLHLKNTGGGLVTNEFKTTICGVHADLRPCTWYALSSMPQSCYKLVSYHDRHIPNSNPSQLSEAGRNLHVLIFHHAEMTVTAFYFCNPKSIVQIIVLVVQTVLKSAASL